MSIFYNSVVGPTYNVSYAIIPKPIPIIEFTSNIVLTAFTGTLTFQIFKFCSNQLQPIPVGPQWNLSRAITTTEATTFSFFVCDCDTCFHKSCTYSAVVNFVGISPLPCPP